MNETSRPKAMNLIITQSYTTDSFILLPDHHPMIHHKLFYLATDTIVKVVHKRVISTEDLDKVIKLKQPTSLHKCKNNTIEYIISNIPELNLYMFYNFIYIQY